MYNIGVVRVIYIVQCGDSIHCNGHSDGHRSFFSLIGDPLFILLCDPFPDPDPPLVTKSRSGSDLRSMITIPPITAYASVDTTIKLANQ